ncbi:MAG: diguanylate cyclase [Candidatus Latescibacterota bacterium]
MGESTTTTPVAGPPGARKLREALREALIQETFGALLVFDVDGFHRFNVERGVEAGDRVLEAIAQHIGEQQGLVGHRIGGDEFGLVIAESGRDFDDGEFRASLRARLRRETGLRLTISGGGVWHPGNDFNIDPRMDEVVLSTAQDLLAHAKEQGPDCVLWLPRAPVESAPVMAVMMRFYEGLARFNSSLARELEIESRVDFLTGLANRRGFEDVFGRMMDGAQRNDVPLALIYLDSDSLKEINDSRGHEAGDRFLVDIARVLNQVVRGSDFISRWGADEFAVLMDNASRERSLALATRILHAVATRTEGTVSMGVYCGVPATVEEAVQQADRALYRAKQAGRNRVEYAA